MREIIFEIHIYQRLKQARTFNSHNFAIFESAYDSNQLSTVDVAIDSFKPLTALQDRSIDTHISIHDEC